MDESHGRIHHAETRRKEHAIRIDSFRVVAEHQVKGWDTYEFNIAGTSANITFFVQTTSTTWSTTVWLTVFAGFAGIAWSWSGTTWTCTSWLGTSGTFQCRWNNFRWQMQVCAQVFNAFVFQVPARSDRKREKQKCYFIRASRHTSFDFDSPVVVSPGELWTNQAFRLKRLHRLDNVQVWNIFELWMFWSIEILLCDHNTLLEEMLVDSYAMLLWHKHSANNKWEKRSDLN